MNRSVTLEDIAREAGVSIAAVSRALNGSPRISEATRARVTEISGRLGYQPRPRRKQRPQPTSLKPRIGLMLLESRSRVWVTDHYISVITRFIKQHGGRLELSELAEHDDPTCETELRHHAHGVDGLLMFGYVRPPIARLLTQVRVPAVVIGDIAPTPAPPPYQVSHDVTRLVDSVIRTLLEAGHQRIAFFASPFPSDGWRDQWLSGYQLAMLRSERGFSPELCPVIDAPNTHELGIAAAAHMARLAEQPSMYIVPQTEAVISFRAAMADHGIHLSREHFIVGGDSETASNHGFSTYPRIGENPLDAATHALKLLWQLIRGESVSPVRMNVPCHMHNFSFDNVRPPTPPTATPSEARPVNV